MQPILAELGPCGTSTRRAFGGPKARTICDVVFDVDKESEGE